MQTQVYQTVSVEETILIARKFAATLSHFPVFIGFTGDLGAGKTTFIRGFSSYFNVNEEVHSPSYTLVNIYEGSVRIYHSDFYRLSSDREVFDLDLFENIGQNSVVLIEWFDKFGDTFYEMVDYRVTIKVLDVEKREFLIEKLK